MSGDLTEPLAGRCVGIDATGSGMAPGYPWRARCIAVIPCRDEETTILPLVKTALQFLEWVLVVDDGSSDQTATLAKQGGATVLRNPGAHGKGAALRLGWDWATEQGFEWAFSLDGDGQHSPEDIPVFCRCAERTSAVLVVGNRMEQPMAIPLVRRITNQWMSKRISRLAGRALPDTQCGFRLIHLDTWKSLHAKTTHFEVESEVLLGVIRRGALVEFVPIRAVYNGEQSKIDPALDTLRWLRWWAGQRIRKPNSPR